MSAADKNWNDIKARASDWAFRLGNNPSNSDLVAFETWRQEDAAHDYAFKAAEAVYTDLAGLGALAEVRDRTPSLRRRLMALLRYVPPAHWLAARPQRWMTGAAAAVAVSVLAVYLIHAPVYETRPAELRAVTLSDGSVIALSGNSRVQTAFTRTERRVALSRGSAFFAVTKDTARPFIVTAGDAVVRVTGTKFDVSRAAEETRVAVVEGTVEVGEFVGDRHSSTAASPPQVITAGQQITATRKGEHLDFRISYLTKPAAVSTTRLDYVNAKLRDIIADANHYYPPGIELATDSLGDLQVTTSFRSTQVEEMVDSLAVNLPININRDPNGRIVIRPRN